MPKKEQKKFKTIYSNMGDEIQALVIDGQIQDDKTAFKRVFDINGVWRITKHSDEYIKQSQKQIITNDNNINMSANAPAIPDLATAS